MSFLYKLRYTFTDELQIKEDTPAEEKDKIYKSQKQMLYDIYQLLKEYLHKDKLTSGIEYRGKTGQFVNNHIHFHFESNSKRDTIAKQFVRKMMEDMNDFRKKSSAYYLKAQSEVNYDKHYMYPLKENDWKITKKYNFCKGIPLEELEILNIKAHSQRLISYEVNEHKQTKKEDLGFVEKFVAYLDKNISPTNHEDTFVALTDFYVDVQDKPPDYKQLYNYSYMYLLKKKIISSREYYNLKLYK